MRACAHCGGSLDGRRRQAIYCGGPCRAAASRARAAHERPSPIPGTSARAAVETAQNRTQGASGHVEPQVGRPDGKSWIADLFARIASFFTEAA